MIFMLCASLYPTFVAFFANDFNLLSLRHEVWAPRPSLQGDPGAEADPSEAIFQWRLDEVLAQWHRNEKHKVSFCESVRGSYFMTALNVTSAVRSEFASSRLPGCLCFFPDFIINYLDTPWHDTDLQAIVVMELEYWRPAKMIRLVSNLGNPWDHLINHRSKSKEHCLDHTLVIGSTPSIEGRS